LTGFGQRPQHLLGTVGLVSFFAGGAGLLYLAVTWLVRLWRPDLFPPLHERPLVNYSLAALLLGSQMMMIGFLAELITAYQGRDEDSYSVVEQTPAATRPPPAPHRQNGLDPPALSAGPSHNPTVPHDASS